MTPLVCGFGFTAFCFFLFVWDAFTSLQEEEEKEKEKGGAEGGV